MTEPIPHVDSSTRVVRNRPDSRRGVYSITGTVTTGDRRGRTLGFPTANLGLPASAQISDGVWVAVVGLPDGRRYFAAVSIGHRPTFYGRQGERLLEAFLLDFAEDLYGACVSVDLHERMRPQRKFKGSSDLVNQLAVDVQKARSWADPHSALLSDADFAEPRHRLARIHRGWWGRGQHRRARKATADKLAEVSTRRLEREEAVAEAVRELLGEEGEALTHQALAKRTGLPEGYLRWAYPTPSALRSAAR